MPCICRFKVTQKAELEHHERGNAFQIKMSGVKAGPFGEATPVANLDMIIIPEESAKEFQVGKVYLVTFSLDPDQSLH